MGRKPWMGLVGACLASLALAGCDNPPKWGGDTTTKKDMTTSTGPNSAAWNSRQTQSSTGNSFGGNNGFSPGTATGNPGLSGGAPGVGNTSSAPGTNSGGAGGSGSLSGNPGASAGQVPYPRDNFRDPPQSGGSMDRGNTTMPVSNNFNDSNTGNLPPLGGPRPKTVEYPSGGSGGVPMSGSSLPMTSGASNGGLPPLGSGAPPATPVTPTTRDYQSQPVSLPGPLPPPAPVLGPYIPSQPPSAGGAATFQNTGKE